MLHHSRSDPLLLLALCEGDVELGDLGAFGLGVVDCFNQSPVEGAAGKLPARPDVALDLGVGGELLLVLVPFVFRGLEVPNAAFVVGLEELVCPPPVTGAEEVCSRWV